MIDVMWFTQTTSGQQLENIIEVANDSIADSPLLWMYSLVYGMSLIAILLLSITRSVLLMKVNIFAVRVFCMSCFQKRIVKYGICFAVTTVACRR